MEKAAPSGGPKEGISPMEGEEDPEDPRDVSKPSGEGSGSSSGSDSDSDGDDKDGSASSGDSSSSGSSSSSSSSDEEDQDLAEKAANVEAALEDEDEEDDEVSWLEVPDASAGDGQFFRSPEDAPGILSSSALGLDMGDAGDGQFSVGMVNLDFFADGVVGTGGGPVDPVFVDEQDDGLLGSAGRVAASASAAELDHLEREIDSLCNSGEASVASSPASLGLGGGGAKAKTEEEKAPSLSGSPPIPEDESMPESEPAPPPPPPPMPEEASEAASPKPPLPLAPEDSRLLEKEGQDGGKYDEVSKDEKVPEAMEEDLNLSDGSSIGEGELHEMLEKEVEESQKAAAVAVEQPPPPAVKKTKIVFVEKGSSHFDPLPEDWIKLIHSSGIPVYLHRPTRVCTMSRPYFLGKGNVKKHSVPVDSIPCLGYRRAEEEEEKARQRAAAAQNALAAGGDAGGEGASDGLKSALLPPAEIRCAEKDKAANSATPNQIRLYCQKLYKTETISISGFRNWRHRRMYTKGKKAQDLRSLAQQNAAKLEENRNKAKEIEDLKTEENGTYGAEGDQPEGPAGGGPVRLRNLKRKRQRERDSLGKGAKLITIPVVEVQGGEGEAGKQDDPLNRRIVKKRKKEWVLNPSRKTPVCILHEYLQQSLKTHPTYTYSSTDSSNMPYRATVVIQGVEYGTGVGSSKKIAKMEAATRSLDILIPDFSKQKEEMESQMPDISFFNNIRVEDPRVTDLCNKLSEPAPYAILLTCLKHNFGLGDTNITSNMREKLNRKYEFALKVQNREVTVLCSNKREGRQLAAQKLLQLLHPGVQYWGQLLAMYGSRAILRQKAKKARESEVTSLQSRDSSRPTPNLAILEKLKEEMKKLSQMRKACAPAAALGKFVPPIDDTTQPLQSPFAEKVNL